MMNEDYDFKNNPEAELGFLRLLLHQKGLPYSYADRALDVYEMRRRLCDARERLLLVDYGYENIAEDIYTKKPIGEQWRESEEVLFNLKEMALSRSRYHILARAYEERQEQDKQLDETYPEY